jgi:phospholipid/cholesterol/gamma-HCH transport system substrate-binding protein
MAGAPAMDNTKMAFRIGLVTLIGCLLLAIFIVYFSHTPRLFTRYEHYVILFPDATGVTSGTPVRKSGVRIGEVESLTLDNETGQVRVGIAVERSFPLRRDDVPTLGTGLLAGDTTVDFVTRPPVDGQPPDRTIIDSGTVIVGIPPVEFRTVLNRSADLVPETRLTLQDIRQSLHRFDALTPQTDQAVRELRDLARESRQALPELRRTNEEVQKLTKDIREVVPEVRRTTEEAQVAARNFARLNERLEILVRTNEDKFIKALDSTNDALTRIVNTLSDENQRNVATTLKNLRAGTDNLEAVTNNTDAFLKESRATLKRLNDTLSRSDELVSTLQQTVKPYSERSANMARQLDESSTRLNITLAELQEFLRLARSEDGTVRRLLADPALYNYLTETAAQAARLMPRIERIMKDVEVFADKVARHPESLGLQGVVHPSSGLKDGPSGWMRPPK